MGKNTLLLLVFGVLTIGVVVWFFSYDAPVATDIEFIDEELSEAPDVGVTASDILENPTIHEGQIVTVRAEVEKWIGPRAFVLDAQGIVDDNLLVITDDPQFVFEDPELFGNAIWSVTGTVQNFEFVTVDERLNLDLTSDLFIEYENMPYIEASSVVRFEN